MRNGPFLLKGRHHFLLVEFEVDKSFLNCFSDNFPSYGARLSFPLEIIVGPFPFEIIEGRPFFPFFFSKPLS